MSTELQRLNQGPTEGEVPNGLGTAQFIAICPGNAENVLKLAKSTLIASLTLSESEKFDEHIWSSNLPKDFVLNCVAHPSDMQISEEAAMPLNERLKLQKSEKWSVRMFMNLFLPELDMRYWKWWDATVLDKRHILVVVAISDWPFPWESLRWLFRGSGATDLDIENDS